MRLPRRLLRSLSAAALAGSVASTTGAVVLDRAGVYASYWDATLDGEARIDGATPGSTYDLRDDVGLDEEDGITEIGAWFHPIGRHRLRFAALKGSFEGGSAIGRSLPVGGVVLPPSTPVESSLDLKMYKGVYGYSFVNMDVVNVAAVAGVDYIDVRNQIETVGSTYAARIKGGVPIVGVTAQFSPVGFFRLYGEATYANWDSGDIDASIVDIAVRAEFYVAHFLGIGAGYRALELEVEDEGAGWLDTATEGYQVVLLMRF